MGHPAHRMMTDVHVLQMTDPTSLHRQQRLHDPLPHPSVSSNTHPALLPALSTASTTNQGQQPLKDDADGEEDDGVIACICAFNTDDGNTIQCDKCMRWQHILCYYPPPEPTPDEASAHYCLDCQPRHLDARKATERQRKALNEQDAEQQLNKKPPAKSHKKKVRDSPSISTAPLNGVDRHEHLSGDGKASSPRSAGPPAAKRPKIAHKPSDKASNPSSRKRGANSTTNTPVSATRSQSPETVIPQYSTEFLRLFKTNSSQVDTATNLMNDIGITNSLSEWLMDPKAVSKATRGLTPGDIFQRWPGRIEDIPGSPEVGVRWVEDPRFTTDGQVPRWAQIHIEDQIAAGAFIGELRGRISHIDHYYANPDNRWQTLRHPLPFVFFHPQLPVCIDARQEGSLFRFVRRSCNPNSKLQTIITEGNEYHFCFMAVRDIMAGEEITVAWSVPESISEKIKTSFGQTNNVQPNVREAICDWVSKVLANCGPCACAGPAHCLMSHYDRRGQAIPKTRKGKQARLSQIDGSVDDSRSRSASEGTYKHESLDDAQGDQSNSATPGSDSRDMTPHGLDAAAAAGALLPELSEREKKKLMREEEMFRKQEQATDKQRKKRPSGGSNLNTPVTATPVRARGSVDMFDRPPRRSTGDSAVPSGESRSNLGKRKAGQSSATSRRKSSASTPRPVYVDAAVQCDMDNDPDQPPLSAVPKRKFVSLTEKLLRRCTLNNLERRASLAVESPSAVEPAVDIMDVDVKLAPTVPAAQTNGVAEGATAATSTAADSLPMVSAPTALVSGTNVDVAMSDAVANATVDAASSPRSVVFSPADPSATSNAPMTLPPTTSSPSRSPLPSIDATVAPVADVTAPTPVTASHEPINGDVDMAPAATADAVAEPAIESTSSDPITAQPSNDTASGSMAAQPPVLSPNALAAVAPNPVRKKLSLKDYTKRSKARPSAGEATPGGILTPSSSLTADPMSALLSLDAAPEQPSAPAPTTTVLTNGQDVKPEQS